MWIQICSNQGAGHMRSQKREIISKSFKNLLMNHRSECIAFWHGTFVELRDSSLFK